MSTGRKADAVHGLYAALAVGLLALAIAGCTGTGEHAAGGKAAETPAAGTPAAGTPAVADSAAPGSELRLASHMTPDEVRHLLELHPEVLVLDVRQPEEWNGDLGHIDVAKQIPLPDLGTRLAELADWKDRPIVTVCRSGRRSEQARQELVKAGFTDVANMDGGMLEWRKTEPK